MAFHLGFYAQCYSDKTSTDLESSYLSKTIIISFDEKKIKKTKL